MQESKKLVRSSTDTMIAGVCSGLATYFGVDPVIIRLIFAALALVNGLGVVLYIVMWIIVPDESSTELSAEETMRSNVNEIGERVRGFGQSIRENPQAPVLIGGVLIAVGALAILREFAPALPPGTTWAVVLIGLGVFMLVRRRG